MMVEEEQISFKSDSLMVDGIEDYSHQIAEMICLRNESNFNEAGVLTLNPFYFFRENYTKVLSVFYFGS